MNRGRKPLCFFPAVWPGTLWAWLLFAAFAVLVLDHAWFFTLDADEAFNATIAKNWVAGLGYSSSLGVIFPFDPYISSGPAYTLVQALPVWWWGNDPDLQKPFIAVIHLLLFAHLAWRIQAYLVLPGAFIGWMGFCLSSFLLVEFRFWHRPAGELLSMLYFANGAWLLAEACLAGRLRAAGMAGLLLAAACLTKGQALLWLLGLGPVLLILAIRRRCVGPLLLAAAAALLPILLWQAYKSTALASLASTDPALFEYGQGKEWHFFSTHGSGLYVLWEVRSWQDLERIVTAVVRLAYSKTVTVLSAYGVLAPLLAGAAPLLAIVMAWSARRDSHLLVLALPLLAFLAWIFLLNNSVYTHQLLPGVWLLVMVAGLWLARWPWLLGGLVCLNLAIFGLQVREQDEQGCLLSRSAACFHIKANPVRQSLQNVLAFLQQARPPAPLANCGWYFAQDIEFALPGANHIQDCMRLLDEAVAFDPDAFIRVNHLPAHFRQTRSTENLVSIFVNKRKNLAGASFVAPVVWKKPLDFTFVAGIYMMGSSQELDRNVMSFLRHCQHVLYRDAFYAVQYCSPENLQAYVQEWGGLPIFTHHWEALYYADFMHTTRELGRSPVHMRPY